MTPKISIILPTYNRDESLPRAIEGILKQTFTDFELLVVDDGSTDQTKEIVDDYRNRDSRVFYFYQNNSGCVASPINLGIRNSKGEYVTFHASDDTVRNDWLEKIFSILNLGEAEVVSCNVEVFNLDTNKVTEISKPTNKNNDYIIETSFIRNYLFGNVVVKRGLFNKVGFFDENLKIREDFDMWIRIAKSGCTFDFVYEPLYKVYIHKNQISSTVNILENSKIAEYLLEKHNDLYRRYPKAHSLYLRNLGTLCFLAGNFKKGRENFIKAIKVSPFNIRSYINLFLSFFGARAFSFIFDIKKRLIFYITPYF